MSTFANDFDSELIILLQSSKIKDRNEGLVKLEKFTLQSSALLNKSPTSLLVSVIDAVFKTIAIEKVAFNKARLSNSIVDRIRRASRLLRNIVEKIRNDRFKRSFKFKHYQAILRSIVQNLFLKYGDEVVFEPVILDFGKILNIMMEMTEFKAHLTSEECISLAKTYLKCLNMLISERDEKQNDTIVSNEKAIVEILGALYNVCFHSDCSQMNYLNLGRSDISYRIIEFIKHYYSQVFYFNKKESLALVILFRLINQTLITISVQDIGNCHKLFKVGLKYFTELRFINFDSLKEQITIFANLAPLFIDLSHIPKQIGDNWDTASQTESHRSQEKSSIASTDHQNEFVSISSSSSRTPSLSIQGRELPLTEKLYLHDLKHYISQLFELILSSSNDYHLSNDDINLKIIRESRIEDINWFNFQYVNMQRTSQLEIAWLLRSGLSATLIRYFRVQQRLNDYKNGSMNADNSIMGRLHKKRKLTSSELESISDHLTSSSNLVEFYLSVIKYMSHEKLLVAALQLLAFTLFGSYGSSDIDKESIEKLVSELLKVFESQDQNLNYWSLLSLKMLLVRNPKEEKFKFNDVHINQILRYSLDLVKASSLTDVACSTICSILRLQSNGLQWHFDSLVMKQFESLVQLAEINGPPTVSRQTLHFWFHVYNFCKTLKFTKSDSFQNVNTVISEKIQYWILSKWDQLLALRNSTDLCLVGIFISWLCGAQDLIIEECSVKEKSYLYDGGMSLLCLQWLTNNELRSFTLLESEESLTFMKDSYTLDPLMTTLKNVKILLDKVLKLEEDWRSFQNKQMDHTQHLYHWVFGILQICESIQTQPNLRSYHQAFQYQLIRVIEDQLEDKRAETNGDKLSLFIKLFNEKFESNPSVINSSFQLLDLEEIARLVLHQLNDKDGSNIDTTSLQGFGNVRKINSTRSSPEPYDSSTNFDQLQMARFIEQDLMIFILNCGLQGGWNSNTILNKCCETLDKFTSYQRQLNCIYTLVNCDKFESLYTESCTQEFLPRLISMYASRFLSAFGFERNEMTIVLGCQILSKFSIYWCTSETIELHQDCADIATFLFQLVGSQLVDSERATSAYIHLMITLWSLNFNVSNDEDKILKLIEICQKSASSLVLMSALDDIKLLLQNQKSNRQVRIYNKLQLLFATPQESVETAATYCFFIGTISKYSYSILSSGIFNLIELSTFSHFRPYIQHSLLVLCSFYRVKDLKTLFKVFRIELFKYWRSYGMKPSDFPFKLLGYSHLNEFIIDNYKLWIALEFSMPSDSNEDILELSLTILNTQKIDLIVDSLAMIIAIAYTEKTMRENIFTKMRLMLKSEAFWIDKLKSQLSLIVFEIIQLADVADQEHMTASLHLVPGSKHLKSLLQKDSSNSYVRTHVSVTPQIAFEAIETTISKLGISPTIFWDTPRIYFITRRILMLVDGSTLIPERVMNLRRLKLLIALPFTESIDEKVTRMLVEELSKQISDIDTANEISSILLVIWQHHCDILDQRLSVPFFTTFLSKVLPFGLNTGAASKRLIRWMKNCSEEWRTGMYCVLKSSLNLASGVSTQITFTQIQTELLIKHTYDDHRNENCLLSLISYILANYQPSDEVQDIKSVIEDDVAEKLMYYDGPSSQPFNLWRAECLGHYYASTGNVCSTINKSIHLTLRKIYESDFDKNIQTMDNVFLEIVRYEGSDIHVECCIDYTLGVVLWRNENKDKDKTFLCYNKNFYTYEETIMKMNFNTYIILLHDFGDLETILHTNSLKQTIGNLPELIASNESNVWMSNLVLSILNDLADVTGLASLVSIFISKNVNFSLRIFNHLTLFYVFSLKDGGARVYELIKTFYEVERDIISTECKQIFINLVLLLRIGAKQNIRGFVTAFSKIDLAVVYHEAIAVGLPEIALLLMENHFTDPTLTLSSNWQTERKFLVDVYSSLDAFTDLIYGLPVEPSLDYGINLLKQNTKSPWTNILFSSGLLDTSLATGKRSSQSSEMVQSTLSTGLNGISRVLGESYISNNKQNVNDDLSYEWAWKLNQWDMPVSRKEISPATENESLYKTLKLIHDYPNDATAICSESLSELMTSKSRFLIHSSAKTQIETLSWLRSLALISAINESLKYNSESLMNRIDNNILLESWYKNADFDRYENILLARKATFEILTHTSNTYSKISKEEACSMVLYELSRYGDLARKCSLSQKSINSAIYFNEVINTNFTNPDREVDMFFQKCAKFQIASMFWDQGETGFPVATLKEILKKERLYRLTNPQLEVTLKLPFKQMQLSSPYITAMIVKWSSESRQESSASIMHNYLDTILMDSVDNVSQQAEIYHYFASFCDQNLKDLSVNDKIIDYNKLILAKEKELQQLKDFKDDRRNSKEDRIAAKSKYIRVYRIRAQDKEELNRIKSNKAQFVLNAIRFYLKCIAISDEYDVDVDRFCGIWLEFSSSTDVNDLVGELIQLIPNYKFIAWVSQLMSRLVDESNSFQKVLFQLLEALTYQHPYHSLYLVKSLILHLNILQNDSTTVSRALAADKLWRALARKSTTFSQKILQPIDEFCDSASVLANEKFDKASVVKLSGLSMGKYWLQSLPKQSLPPPTREIAVNKNGDYDDIPYIIATDSNVRVATSGISLPKIMKFKLSNGEFHKMLLKGGSDDLRQDAIMEQVFEKVNKIFRSYRDTRVRNLRIRTYRVVPLGPQAGIIEFVRNSVALNDILKPLHERRDKLKLDGARSLMKKVQKSTLDERIKAYKSISEKVKPVMRLFFYDTFLDPQEWFQSKITYTRGISTTSFVGYILGLGDRHSNNILLDNSTGEPIHIDLGVAFDQGKRLPIPETVPFRLTRDIVDGFGITGVEGCFIKSSEQVLKVLRLENQRIMDILNILKYDPLYSWTLSPIRKQRLQEQDEMFITEDIEANDAIEGVRKKLVSNDLSVELMVRELTQELMDPENLACIYMGWSPFY